MTSGWVDYRGGNRAQASIGRTFAGPDVVEERGVCLDAFGQDFRSQHMMTVLPHRLGHD